MVSIHKVCKNCGTSLGNDATWRKQFCTDKCRVQYHRKESNQAHYAHAIQPISKLGKAKTSREKREAIETLKLLRKAIDDQLRVLGDFDTVEKYDLFSGNAPKKLYCKSCGQQVFTIPKRGEKCEFCGECNWNYDTWQNFLDTKDPITYD